MGLALGSSSIYGGQEPSKNKQTHKKSKQTNAVRNHRDQQEAVMLKLQSEEDLVAEEAVLMDLVALEPMIVEQIVIDESNLEATFDSIRSFVNKKNTEIEKLNKDKEVSETEVAKLAVELTDAQAALEKATARQRAKHRHNNRHEQSIKDALMKSEQGLKSLNKKAVNRVMPKMAKSKKKNNAKQ